MNASIDISKVCLETNRLYLRAFQENDLEDFYSYASVPGVGERAGWNHHTSREVTKEILNSFIKNKKTFAIVYKETNKVIGSLGIEFYDEEWVKDYDFSKGQGREIGYVLSKEYWGNGLMPEAVKAVLSYLFEEVELDFVLCSHSIDNLPSKRVQEKCGFTFIKEIIREVPVGKRISRFNIIRKEEYQNGKN